MPNLLRIYLDQMFQLDVAESLRKEGYVNCLVKIFHTSVQDTSPVPLFSQSCQSSGGAGSSLAKKLEGIGAARICFVSLSRQV